MYNAIVEQCMYDEVEKQHELIFVGHDASHFVANKQLMNMAH
jgi:hypothetical protein